MEEAQTERAKSAIVRTINVEEEDVDVWVLRQYTPACFTVSLMG